MDYTTLIPQAFMVALSLLMLRVIYTDARFYTISNLLNVTVLFLYGVAAFLLPSDVVTSLAAAGVIFIIGLALFALGLMGGGDVKLLTVLTLWTGWSVQSMVFLFLTAVAGGALVIVVLLLRFFLPPVLFKANPTRPIPRLLVRKEPVPYGIAIAGGFLWLLWTGGIPMLAGAIH